MKTELKIEYNNETNDFKVLGFTESNGETYIVEGDCIRCGQCCISRCNQLTVDTDENGRYIYTCIIQGMKPALCAIWPKCKQDFIDNPKCSYKLILKT